MIKINNLTYTYANTDTPVLKNINASFESGNLYSILGNNGCGKSTLLKCIDGLCQTQGKITINNNDISTLKSNERAKLLSYCPQNTPSNNLSVFDSIMIGRRSYINFAPNNKDKEIVNNAIESFDLKALKDKPTNMLSGGEFQRVCIARTVAQDSPVMMLDEPTNNLDIKYQHVLMHQLQHMAKDNNKCIICVLHDINMAITHADKLLFMKDSEIITVCQPDQVNEKMFKQIYDIEPKIVDIDGYRAVFV